MIRSLILGLIPFAFGIAHVKAEETAMDRALIAAFEAGELRDLHVVIATYKGETLTEVYFKGDDQNWGAPLPVRQHGPDTLHDVRSISKSITSLLYGVALGRGLVPDVSARLLNQFPEYPELARDPERAKITIADTLTMQMGVAWDETIPYSDPRNSEIAMELAEDRYHFALSQPMQDEPGTRWVYNGGATALIGRIIEKGAGMPLADFAADALFTPLGIDDFEWATGRDGQAAAASGLRLSARSLLTIGEMMKAGGMHEGAEIVPNQWITASKQPRADTGFGLRYGYFWWLPPGTAAPRWLAGFGHGGQRLTVNSVDDLILVVLGGRYNQADDWKLPVKVIRDFLLPAIQPPAQ